jgi:hypothetical protein
MGAMLTWSLSEDVVRMSGGREWGWGNWECPLREWSKAPGERDDDDDRERLSEVRISSTSPSSSES